MKTLFQVRRSELVSKLNEAKLDCLLVAGPANWYYLTGFTGESAALIVAPRGTTLFTDGRFTFQAREETSGVRVVVQKASLFESVRLFFKPPSPSHSRFPPTLPTLSP